ncbi:MAG: aldo/keto reductase [Pseudomonadota bacterium]
MSHSQIGLGCWPLSGEMYLDGKSVGYATGDPAQATRILHAAHDAGVTLFDTAHAYGAGLGERQIGQALAGRDVTIVTKIGLGIDEASKTITGLRTDAAQVSDAIDESLSRLKRDYIDCVLLHPNSLPIPEAEAMFDELNREVTAGRIGSFGWSTDFPANATVQTDYPAARHVEHVMNVFLHAPDLRAVTEPAGITSLIRSPLAMGLLAGRFDNDRRIDPGDVRVESHGGMDWFQGDGAHPRFAARLAAVRELLQSDGRTLAQGALCWLLAHGDHILPVPGASSVEQAVANAGAMEFGPLPDTVMQEIATLIPDEVPEPRAL